MRPWTSCTALLLATCGPLRAQDSRPDVRERLTSLAQRLCSSLRAPDSPPAVTAFRAFLTVTPQTSPGAAAAGPLGPAGDVEHVHQVRTEVLYADPGWIRYEIRDQKGTQARMFDGVSYWQLDTAGRKIKLSAREDESTREAMKREISLARQVTRFLFLDRLLTGLADVRIVEEDHRPPGAPGLPRIPVLVVTGVAADFPMYLVPQWGEDRRVRLEVRITRGDTPLPIAVRASPVDPRIRAVEEVRVEGFQEVAGIRLPKELRVYEVDAAGNRRYRLQVELARVELNPEVDRSRDFGFPR
jgi:hypothetical protein